MTILKTLSRYISGFVFIFSGLVKGIDPEGSMYKFMDYFTAFNLDVPESLAYILGVLLCTAEFIIGFAVFTKLRIRPASWGLLLFMLVFTPLTLFLAISNPVSDCGCFGDAVHLSNWQTFYKNIIITIFVIIVFINRKNYRTLSKPAIEWTILFIMTVAFILFTQYNKKHLPLVDFRPYKTGTDIQAGMMIPEGAPTDEYETVLIYEKEGVEKEFSLENYPSEDTTWTFSDSKTRLIKKGYTPPIKDFSLITPEGQDLTSHILSDEGFNLFMLSINFSDARQGHIEKGLEAGIECINNGIGFYILTSSAPPSFNNYDHDFNVLFVDETTMKTIIRSNPGFMVMKDGIVTKKWAAADLPEKKILGEIIKESYPVKKTSGSTVLILLLAGIVFISFMINFLLRKH